LAIGNGQGAMVSACKTIGDWKWARGNGLRLQDYWRLEMGKGQ